MQTPGCPDRSLDGDGAGLLAGWSPPDGGPAISLWVSGICPSGGVRRRAGMLGA
jgi:hypothetical protein